MTCFDGFGIWDIHNCRTREIARDQKIFHEGLRNTVKIATINFTYLPLQFPQVKIWDRKLHSWIQ